MTNPYVGPPAGTPVNETAAAGFAAIAQGKADPSQTFGPLIDSIKADQPPPAAPGAPSDPSAAPVPLGAGGDKLERQAADLVQKYLGVKYQYGGTTPTGFDCSGLVQYVYRSLGVTTVPRTTYAQWDAGQPVGPKDLQPGDAVFFTGSDPQGGKPGHEGLYIGNGMYIAAPHTGATVSVFKLSDAQDFVGARRFA